MNFTGIFQRFKDFQNLETAIFKEHRKILFIFTLLFLDKIISVWVITRIGWLKVQSCKLYNNK